MKYDRIPHQNYNKNSSLHKEKAPRASKEGNSWTTKNFFTLYITYTTYFLLHCILLLPFSMTTTISFTKHNYQQNLFHSTKKLIKTLFFFLLVCLSLRDTFSHVKKKWFPSASKLCNKQRLLRQQKSTDMKNKRNNSSVRQNHFLNTAQTYLQFSTENDSAPYG